MAVAEAVVDVEMLLAALHQEETAVTLRPGEIAVALHQEEVVVEVVGGLVSLKSFRKHTMPCILQKLTRNVSHGSGVPPPDATVHNAETATQ